MEAMGCQPRRSNGRNNLCRVRSCTLRWRARSRRRLEKSVNKRRERRAISEDQHAAQEQQENQDRRDPPSLTYAQEMQEFLNDCQLHWSYQDADGLPPRKVHCRSE